METIESHGTTTPILDVTLLHPKLKHPAIFERFDDLTPGAAFYLLSDHDPKPVYYQMKIEKGHVFSWTYEEQGPVWWKILIRKNVPDEEPTVGEIAAADMRNANVFRKYGIDFCCGGKKSLREACEEKNLDAAVVEKSLQQALQDAHTVSFEFNRWQIDFLAAYIFNEHHQYWYNEEPIISDLVVKVAGHHGQQYPELVRIKELYTVLRQELFSHFMKEERVIFPHIKRLVKAKHTNQPPEIILDDINEPLQMMEADHEAAGELLLKIRTATNDYTVPEGLCNSTGLLYYKLKLLEEDLHQHIHLENNILFPKAAQLHKELIKQPS